MAAMQQSGHINLHCCWPFKVALAWGRGYFQGGLRGKLKITVKLTIISLHLQLPILGFCTILNWDPVSQATPFAERKGVVTLQLMSCQRGTYIAVILHGNGCDLRRAWISLVTANFCRGDNLMVAVWPDPSSLVPKLSPLQWLDHNNTCHHMVYW